jgi:glycosyltransferase involved in cell wall biosynthesis
LIPNYGGPEPRHVTELNKVGANLLFFKFRRSDLPGNIHRLRALLKQHRIDVVYTHFGSRRFQVEAAARLAGISVARGEHNFAFHQDRRFRFLKKLFWRWTTDYFIPVSQAVADHLREHGVLQQNFRVVHDGFDLERYRAPEPGISHGLICNELQLDRQSRFLVCVAKIHPAKRQRLLIDALRCIPDSTVVLLLVGSIADANYADEIRDEARKSGLQKRVLMLGYRADVPKIMDAAEISYLPSLVEGLGNVVIESCLMSTPVIAADLPAIREIIDDQKDGYLVASAEPQEYARLTSLLLADRMLRIRIGTAAREKVQDRFSRERFVEQSILALRDCHAMRGSRRKLFK